MNYNTTVIEEPNLDHLKNYAPFFFQTLKEYIDYNFDIIDLDRIYSTYDIETITEQYGYSRELDGTRYDILFKIIDSPEKFNFNILNNVNENQSQNCILTFINNSIKMIKYMIFDICIKNKIELPSIELDGDLNISLTHKGKKLEKYINININIGNSSARTYIVDK